MAYNKPGVEITQVQKSFSPTLISPDLGAAVIAPAYKVVPHEGDGSYTYSQTFANNSTPINISGLTSSLYLDGSSVYVDIVKTTGTLAAPLTGRVHFDNSELTVSSDAFGPAGTVVLPSGSGYAGYIGGAIRIGYRALNVAVTLGFKTFESLDDITSVFGSNQAVYDNPLPFALIVALQNTNTQIYAVAMGVDVYASVTASGTDDGKEHIRARGILESQEVYALAPYTNEAAVVTAYSAHCDQMSLATEKHERVVFASPEITFYDSGELSAGITPATADKAATARKLRDAAAVVLKKRTYFVRPDVAFFQVSDVPVQKLKQSYLEAMYKLGETIYAKLATSVALTMSDGSVVSYSAKTDITDAVYANLKAAVSQYKYSAYIPMPGFFTCASIVGQTAGEQPEQGFTNLPLVGPSDLKYSTDYFSESQLNTIAEGGNYIMVQAGGQIFSRHQLSTNMTSVEAREYNIVKSVDFVAKFIRKSLTSYIGRYLITSGFLEIVGVIVNGLGQACLKAGHINGFKLIGVKQDPVEKDVVRVSFEMLPLYPVNYIRVDLIF
jgi:hypothetical protein